MFMVATALTFAVCISGCRKDEEKIKYVTQELRFDLPEELANATSASINRLMLKNMNTGEVFNIMQPMEVAAPTASAAKGKSSNALYATQAAAQPLRVKVTVPEGLYNIEMEGTAYVALPKDGEASTFAIKAYLENVSITEADIALGAVSSATFIPQNPKDATWVIAEILFAGTQTPEGKQYMYNNYIRIYNNSDRTLNAAGLTIAESELLTVSKNDYKPSPLFPNFPAAHIYRIPTDTVLMVEPGESLLLVDAAIDHTAANSNSWDLTTADFEWYTDPKSATNSKDTDNPDVPNMELVRAGHLAAWSMTTQGNRSYALCRLGDDENNQLTANEFVSTYSNVYKYVFAATGRTMSSNCVDIPHKWIIDAVNCAPSSKWEWNLFPPSLDMGYTHVVADASDKTRYGKSVRRKVKSGIVLQDTNNSTVDFEAVNADPFHKFN